MIRRVDHINIATHDLKATRDFFVEVLGFEEGWRPEAMVAGYWLYADGKPIVHLQPARGPIVPSQDSALNHAAFEVAELDVFIARLERHGIAFKLMDIPGAPVRQIFTHDPNGVMIELNCPR